MQEKTATAASMEIAQRYHLSLLGNPGSCWDYLHPARNTNFMSIFSGSLCCAGDQHDDLRILGLVSAPQCLEELTSGAE